MGLKFCNILQRVCNEMQRGFETAQKRFFGSASGKRVEIGVFGVLSTKIGSF